MIRNYFILPSPFWIHASFKANFFITKFLLLTRLSHHECVVEHKINMLLFIPFLYTCMPPAKWASAKHRFHYLIFGKFESGGSAKKARENVKYRVDLTLVKIHIPTVELFLFINSKSSVNICENFSTSYCISIVTLNCRISFTAI